MRDFAMDLVVLSLWVLALARVTRLLTRDEITDGLRIAVLSRHGENSRVGYFVQCPWCMSVWIAFASVPYALWITGWSWRLLPLIALSGSYVTGIMASNLEPEDDAEIEIHDDGS